MSRYRLSCERSTEATQRFEKMSRTLQAQNIEQWEHEIETAERDRYQNPAAMDMMAARQLRSDHDVSLPSQSQENSSAAEEWIIIALSIEERQLVVTILCLAAILTSFLTRLEVQDKVRLLSKDPREEDRQEIERLRGLLRTEFDVLQECHRRATSEVGNICPYPEDDTSFDNLDASEGATSDSGTLTKAGTSRATASAAAAEQFSAAAGTFSAAAGTSSAAAGTSTLLSGNTFLLPERRPFLMPSTFLPTTHSLSSIELKARKLQAGRYLNALRDVIAEKSLQYTDVIRKAPNKAVRTRGRNIIAELNKKIMFYSRVYRRCRAAMVRLGADEETLGDFRELGREDVRASSAMIDPNQAGSTSLSLSWIWSSFGNDGSLEHHLKCNVIR